jgi:hypothetical protein
VASQLEDLLSRELDQAGFSSAHCQSNMWPRPQKEISANGLRNESNITTLCYPFVDYSNGIGILGFKSNLKVTGMKTIFENFCPRSLRPMLEPMYWSSQ